MAGCAAQRFTGVGPAVFACLQSKGAAGGVPMAGATGQATTMGVTVRWDYDATAETLVLECTDAPFFVPCSTVTERLKSLVEGCMARAV